MPKLVGPTRIRVGLARVDRPFLPNHTAPELSLADPTPSRRRRPAVYVGPLEDRHHAALASFFGAAWDAEATAASVAAWRSKETAGNPAEADVEPPKWVFTRDDHVLGYLGTIPERFVVNGEPFTAYWLKGFWVDPEFRSGPVGFEVLRAAVETLHATAALVVAPEARRLFEAQGLAEQGVLFNRIYPLRAGRILANVDPDSALAGVPSALRLGIRAMRATRTTGLAGALLSQALRLGKALRPRPESGLTLRHGWEALPESSLDGLWQEFRTTVAGTTSRDADFLRWRYGDPDLYRVVGVWRGDRLRGWAVIRSPTRQSTGRLKGTRVASLSDLLFPLNEPAVGRAVVAAAVSVAADLNADALLCSGSHPALASVLRNRGFLKLPGNVRFMTRDGADRVFPSPLESWWLTRGDSKADDGI